jgi:hypothetical protein
MATGTAPTGGRADLHAHTWYSDGRDSPERLIARAAEHGIQLLAVTDHDTLAGLSEAESAGRAQGVEIVPGIEFSTYIRNVEVHVLGLWIDPHCPALLQAVSGYEAMRRQRAERMVEKLNALGVKLDFSQVLAVERKGVFGRPHVAQALKDIGAVGAFQEAFQRFLGRDAPAYVPKRSLGAAETIAAIHAAGGVAVLAHGLVGGANRPHVEAAARLGIDAVETVHPKLGPEQSAWLREFAGKAGLAVSGGSDWHGEGWSEGRIGEWTIPLEAAAALRARAGGLVTKAG